MGFLAVVANLQRWHPPLLPFPWGEKPPIFSPCSPFPWNIAETEAVGTSDTGFLGSPCSFHLSLLGHLLASCGRSPTIKRLSHEEMHTSHRGKQPGERCQSALRWPSHHHWGTRHTQRSHPGCTDQLSIHRSPAQIPSDCSSVTDPWWEPLAHRTRIKRGKNK